MSNLVENGDIGLLIRTKWNAFEACMRIATTDEVITAGAVTSIPIATLSKNLLPIGAKVTLVEYGTGEAHELTLTDALVTGSTAITVSSHTFATDVAAGSYVYYKMEDFLASYYEHITPA